jgi:hypothetical protein
MFWKVIYRIDKVEPLWYSFIQRIDSSGVGRRKKVLPPFPHSIIYSLGEFSDVGMAVAGKVLRPARHLRKRTKKCNTPFNYYTRRHHAISSG